MVKNLGKYGENIAIAFLKNKFYEIIAVNWRSSHHEIDIVAKLNGTLVIIEVKTRSSDTFGHPSEFVKSNKHRNLFKATDALIEDINHSGEVRFDIIAVYQENQKWIVDHIEDAFYPN
ncbi:MAG TPA: YraN family protein [Chitinophagales bacterium]|nr:YraN family protein [Chitinophagales bacterium]